MVYYTLGGIFPSISRSLSTGDVTVTHDFGSGNIVRDVQVRENTCWLWWDGVCSTGSRTPMDLCSGMREETWRLSTSLHAV